MAAHASCVTGAVVDGVRAFGALPRPRAQPKILSTRTTPFSPFNQLHVLFIGSKHAMMESDVAVSSQSYISFLYSSPITETIQSTRLIEMSNIIEH